MKERILPRIPAGMRDILPAQMLKRQYVLDLARDVFETFGFEPLQTPVMELTETLAGKYGEDAERLIYKAWYGDTPDGELSLRYDLSVPLARLMAMYPDLPQPFKRYQIAPVWRADRPQKGRYREFYQCDADIVGSPSMLADAEIVALIYGVLKRLGFSDFSIALNDRKILDGIGQYAGVPENLQAGLYRSIDKLDKVGLEGVQRELLMVGVPDEFQSPLQSAARRAIQGRLPLEDLAKELAQGSLDQTLIDLVLTPLADLIRDATAQDIDPGELQAVTTQLVSELAPQFRQYYGDQIDRIPADVVERLLDLLQVTGSNAEILSGLEKRLTSYPRALEGIADLRSLLEYLTILGVPYSVCAVSFAMVRGLEYYTGPIYEATVRKPKAMPSICGGGRYDELIGLFSGVDCPATGASLGIERIIDAMEELEMFPSDIRLTTADVLVTVFDADTLGASLSLATELRQAGIGTLVYYEYTDRLGDQIAYAAAKGVPLVIILGPDELSAGKVTLRWLGETQQEGTQRMIPRRMVADAILNR